MSDKEIEELKSTIPNYIDCYKDMSEEQKKLEKELSLREMINSIWCYGGDCYNSTYIDDYYKEDEIWHTYTLTKERVFEIVDDQLNYLNNNCKIIKNVMVDDDGISYNHIVEKECE